MNYRQWATRAAALIAAAFILAGCGGGSDAQTPAPYSQAAVPSRVDANASIDDQRSTGARFKGREMVGFSYIGNNSYANASLKLLMSAIGPQNLIDHLEKFKQNTQDAQKQVAADRFIGLIDKAYYSPAPLRNEVKELIDLLQTLPPFDKLNEQGALEFNLNEGHVPAHFIDQLTELFDFKAIPGWSLDIKSTVTTNAEVLPDLIDRFFNGKMYRIAAVNSLGRESLSELSLQRVVDAIHTTLNITVPGDSKEKLDRQVNVTRQPRITDPENFTRLTVLPAGMARIKYYLDDRVTLTALNVKTNENILIGLQPKEVLVLNSFRYKIKIKNDKGEWKIHDDLSMASGSSREGDELHMINLAVMYKTRAQ